MADIEIGFSDFADDLNKLLEVVTDEDVHAKVLEACTVPVVNHAKMLAPRGRTGRLAQSIGAQYSTMSKSARIGIGEPVSRVNSSTGFYGRFQNDGWHITHRRRKASAKGDFTKDARIGRRTGRVRAGIRFLGTAMDAQEGNALRIIIDELKKAVK